MTVPSSVALISAGYPPHMAGGIDVQTYDLAHALASSKVDVTVFCGGAKHKTCIRENENLEILRLPMANIPPRVVWFQLQNIGIFKEKLPNFDIVHTQHSSGSIYAFLKEKIGKPWIVSFHDHQLTRLKILFNIKPWNLSAGDVAFYTFGYPTFELLTRMELTWADHYIACGATGIRDYVNFSKMDPAKTTVIPNGIDVEKITSILHASREQETSEDRDFVIFTCGRLYASKGVEYLIRAMPQVLRNCRNAKLKIFGKGPLHSYLQNLISSLQLRDNVSLEGHVPYNQLVHEMNMCDLAVFPSLVEVGASLAVMEAMACHKVVVAFDYPFSNEIIRHLKNGYLVPPKNAGALAEAVCALISDERLRRRIGENAYHDVVENHDTKNIVKAYLEVYCHVLSDKESSA